MINKTDQGIVRDACLIAEQKIKHYEIASYGTLHAAKQWEKLKRSYLLI
jgi:ferritin-like metal-binding protein YciE